jgi:hypothetical protein
MVEIDMEVTMTKYMIVFYKENSKSPVAVTVMNSMEGAIRMYDEMVLKERAFDEAHIIKRYA